MWTDECAAVHKEELLELIEKFGNDNFESTKLSALARYGNTATQTSNTVQEEFTVGQVEYASITTEQSVYYMGISGGTSDMDESSSEDLHTEQFYGTF